MNAWQIMAIGIVLSVFACLIFIAVMRWIASPIIWLSITGIFASLSYGKAGQRLRKCLQILIILFLGIYFSFLKYQYFKQNPVVRHDVQPNVVSYVCQFILLLNASSYFVCILVEIVVWKTRNLVVFADWSIRYSSHLLFGDFGFEKKNCNCHCIGQGR